MLAMKCLAARADSYDAFDIEFLISKMGLVSVKEVEDIILKYYPEKTIPQKTFYFIEEIIDSLAKK